MYTFDDDLLREHIRAPSSNFGDMPLPGTWSTKPCPWTVNTPQARLRP